MKIKFFLSISLIFNMFFTDSLILFNSQELVPVRTRGSKYPYSKSAINILIKNSTVKIYVEPIITGKSITLIASKYNLPIPGQSNTASVIIAPPSEPDRLSASMVTIGGAAILNA